MQETKGDNLQFPNTAWAAWQPAFEDSLRLNYFCHFAITAPSGAGEGVNIYREGLSSDICPENRKKMK